MSGDAWGGAWACAWGGAWGADCSGDTVVGGGRVGARRKRRFSREDAEPLFYRRVAEEARNLVADISGPDAPLPTIAAQGESVLARIAYQTASKIVREAQQSAKAGRIREREILDEVLRLIDDASARRNRWNRIAMLLALWWFA